MDTILSRGFVVSRLLVKCPKKQEQSSLMVDCDPDFGL